MWAAFVGNVQIVRLLVDNAARLDGKNKAGMTSLMIAAQGGCLETVRLLVERGAKREEKNNSGATSLAIAAFEGNLNGGASALG
jgi:ankyrin repeat protein